MNDHFIHASPLEGTRVSIYLGACPLFWTICAARLEDEERQKVSATRSRATTSPNWERKRSQIWVAGCQRNYQQVCKLCKPNDLKNAGFNMTVWRVSAHWMCCKWYDKLIIWLKGCPPSIDLVEIVVHWWPSWAFLHNSEPLNIKSTMSNIVVRIILLGAVVRSNQSPSWSLCSCWGHCWLKGMLCNVYCGTIGASRWVWNA